MTLEELKNNPEYIFDHMAVRRGYVSRKKECEIKPYSGRFGDGYMVLYPRFDSSQYIYVEYYIKV